MRQIDEDIKSAIQNYLRNRKDYEDRAEKINREYDQAVEDAVKKYNKEAETIKQDHPGIHGSANGRILGALAGIPVAYWVMTLIEKALVAKNKGAASLVLALLAGGFGTAIASQVVGTIAGAGLGLSIAKIKDKLKEITGEKNESLGERILEKLYRITEDEVEEFEPEEKGTSDAPEAGEDKVEKSETLKKLEGHLLRFQEEESKHPWIGGAAKGAAAGAAIGGVTGRVLGTIGGKHVYKEQGKMAKKAQVAQNATANAAGKQAQQAAAKGLEAKMLKSAGNKKASKEATKQAWTHVNTANDLDKMSKGYGKMGKEYHKAVKKAAGSGMWKGIRKGAKYGAIGGLGLVAGKKLYDHIKNN